MKNSGCGHPDRLPPTRMGLLETRARRQTAAKGASLLRGKREAVASEFFRLMTEVVAGRRRLGESLRDATRALTLARALDGEERLQSLALAAGREIPVEIARRKVWGIPVPEVRGPGLRRASDARGSSPLGWGLGAAAAARGHEEALEVLLSICSREVRLRRLGEEIRGTSRRINALEQSVIPRLDHETAWIALALEEREREDLARLKRFKARRAPPGEAGTEVRAPRVGQGRPD